MIEFSFVPDNFLASVKCPVCLVLTLKVQYDILYRYVGTWCSGNTQDFDSCIAGSNPAVPAKRTGFLTRPFLFSKCSEPKCIKVFERQLKNGCLYSFLCFASSGIFTSAIKIMICYSLGELSRARLP